MTPFSYRTIAAPAEGQYKEKGSRFLAFAYPVSSEPAIKEHLAGLEKKYHDARHHCYAWTLGAEKKSFRAFDDGEPGHSAGDPILGQIRSRDLTNVLVVVVRYFGGVKLGVGGLITAYRTAAGYSLDSAQIIEKEVTEAIRITYGYEATPEVMRLVKEFDLVVESQDFQSDCSLTAAYRVADKEKFFEKLERMRATGVKVRYE
ncbi:MAG TPA: YigZ family protein [Chryseosolibacter sp.]